MFPPRCRTGGPRHLPRAAGALSRYHPLPHPTRGGGDDHGPREYDESKRRQEGVPAASHVEEQGREIGRGLGAQPAFSPPQAVVSTRGAPSALLSIYVPRFREQTRSTVMAKNPPKDNARKGSVNDRR